MITFSVSNNMYYKSFIFWYLQWKIGNKIKAH